MIRQVFALLFVICISLLVACKKDKEKVSTEPSAAIVLNDIGESVKVLDSVGFTLEASLPSGIASANAYIWLGDQPLDTVLNLTKDSLATSISEPRGIRIAPAYAGMNMTFTFAVSDVFGNQAGDTVSFLINESVIAIIEGQTMAGFGNDQRGSFYDVQKDTVYYGSSLSSTNVKKSIDFVFYFTTSEKRILAAPENQLAEETWKDQIDPFWPLFGVENATALYSLSSNVDYEGVITSEQIAAIMASAGAPADSLIDIQEDQILGFELATSRGGWKGLMQVTEIQGGSSSTGGITFNIKMQK